MKNLKIETFAGEHFSKVAIRAKNLSKKSNLSSMSLNQVEFEFNGILCIVNSNTNGDHLWRDYFNAHLLGWKEVGPDCVVEYSNEIVDKIKTEQEIIDRKNAKEQETGFMYGAAIQVLSKCWVHGEDLRKWHNKEYGHEGEGVVNPAILNIS